MPPGSPLSCPPCPPPSCQSGFPSVMLTGAPSGHAAGFPSFTRLLMSGAGILAGSSPSCRRFLSVMPPVPLRHARRFPLLSCRRFLSVMPPVPLRHAAGSSPSCPPVPLRHAAGSSPSCRRFLSVMPAGFLSCHAAGSSPSCRRFLSVMPPVPLRHARRFPLLSCPPVPLLSFPQGSPITNIGDKFSGNPVSFFSVPSFGWALSGKKPLDSRASFSCHSRRFLAGIQGLFLLSPHSCAPDWEKTSGFPIKNVGNDRGEDVGHDRRGCRE